MDIHKPKPWHGWREFVGEIGVIVIGVLIALGAEQMVLALHERQLSQEARESVRAELNLGLANAKRLLDPAEPCVQRRIAEIGAVLDRAARGERFQPIGYVGIPPTPAVYTQRWEAAAAGGRTSLLPINEQRDFARVYAQLGRMQERSGPVVTAWAHLAALEGQSTLSPETIARAREALAEARFQDYGVRDNFEQAKAYAQPLHITGNAQIIAYNRGVMASVCVPITSTRAEAAAKTKHPMGVP